ncbi:Oxidoreductase probably involved in sulfite reduction [hydrothermal vent metagenome]|uniref:Oxidoreductase probably involved in sulfite reduction n=1 Tax=hydrothermal vent metagenome TaxID=652676 RepID=A0A3B1A124_9ZZZZ
MQIIKDQKIIDDCWQHLTEEVNITNLPDGNIIVTLNIWKTAKESLITRQSSLGIKLSSDELLPEILADLNFFELIALDFTPYKDGRHFSTARLLRERHNYKGEIRATGDVLRDQLLYMQRVGFDAFELGPNQDPETALTAFDDFSTAYQSTADQNLPAYQRK